MSKSGNYLGIAGPVSWGMLGELQAIMGVGDGITKDQYYEQSRSTAERAPEYKLWMAVFEGAVRRLQKLSKLSDYSRSARARAEAERQELTDWFMSPSKFPASFEFVCDVLGLEASQVRARILTETVEIPRRMLATRRVISARRGAA